MGQPAAGQTITVPPATSDEKIRAAQELGIVVTPELLILDDRNFVFALWRQATGPEVRASAELALGGSDAECTQWIRTEVHDANRRDQENEIRDAEAARLARELKQRAAAVIGYIPEPEVLVKSYRDFVYELWQRATGPRVKEAALAAFGGTEDEQKEFLNNGIREAHAQDQQDAIDRDEQASEEEKARLAARAAKSRAAAVLGVVASEGMLALSDDNFIREIWNLATEGTEVHSAAVAALRSPDPAVWKHFIDVGIFEANNRDIQNALRRKEEADRRRALEILTQAENDGMHPHLAAVARRALAGKADDVDYFLRLGRHQAYTQSLRSTSAGFTSSYVQDLGGKGVLTRRDPVGGKPGSENDMTWQFDAGLANPGCYSLESVQKPGYYLRKAGFRVEIAPAETSAAYKADATWCAHFSPSGKGMALESYSAKGRFLRHYNGKLWASNGKGGSNPFDTPRNYVDDGTWHIDWPSPNAVSALMLRWNNEDPVKARLGNPVADEAADGAVRYREFERGRLYWSHGTGAHDVRDEILAAYLRLGGHRFDNFGPPVNDQSTTPDGIGRYNHFQKGGSIYWTPDTGAHTVYGAIRQKWASMGWEKSYLGYPTSDEFAIPGGRRNTFQGGRIDHDLATGKTVAYPN